MYQRQHDSSAQDNPELSTAQPQAEALEAEVDRTANGERLVLAAPGAGGIPDPKTQAALLSRAGGNRLARAGDSLLQLQRQYGNRYVQRVVQAADRNTSRQSNTGSAFKNGTGLPNQLRAGLEQLSGLDLSAVRVHYNSTKPGQLNALAYTQGQDIHVGPGQKQHLPHEGWHVVQQIQGRVQPTMQARGAAINDDTNLEREADVMGAKAQQLRRSADAATKTPSHLSATRSTSHQLQVVQRAVGMEFECSNLEIVKAPEGTEKGAVIKAGEIWSMTYEDTSEGTPVVEFIIGPASNEVELFTAVDKIKAEAAQLDTLNKDQEQPFDSGVGEIRAGGKRIPAFTIKKTETGPVEGAIQVTIGVPLENIPNLYNSYFESLDTDPPLAYKRYKEIKDKELAPSNTKFSELSNELKGFILLIMDYIRSGYVPEEHRGKAAIPFAKGLFNVMARTDFKAIFKILSEEDKKMISDNDASGEREMKDDWWKWLIKMALTTDEGNIPDNITNDFLNRDKLFNIVFKNWRDKQPTITRKDFLKRIPSEDKLTTEGFLGLGEYGNKVDVNNQADSPKFAPIFEIRKPFGSSRPYTDWGNAAQETWKKYNKIVNNETFVPGGKVE